MEIEEFDVSKLEVSISNYTLMVRQGPKLVYGTWHTHVTLHSEGGELVYAKWHMHDKLYSKDFDRALPFLVNLSVRIRLNYKYDLRGGGLSDTKLESSQSFECELEEEKSLVFYIPGGKEAVFCVSFDGLTASTEFSLREAEDREKAEKPLQYFASNAFDYYGDLNGSVDDGTCHHLLLPDDRPELFIPCRANCG